MKKRFRSDRGSILMEFVIVAPMLLLLIFGIIQFSLIFMARELLYYAAYSAARTALVYNIRDYTRSCTGDSSSDFLPDSGPLYLAACTVMSWLNFGDGSAGFRYFPKKDADVWWQVRISGKERVVMARNSLFPETFQYRGTRQIPTVAVTVHYYYPLLVPLVGDMIAYALAGNIDQNGAVPQKNDSWETFGWAPGDDYAAVMQTVTAVEDAPKKKIYRYQGIPVIHLQDTCYMVKPYRTSTYARIPTGDLDYMRER